LGLDEANAMNCEEARDLMVLLAYGELPEAHTLGLDHHLTTCVVCITELEQLQRMDALLAFHPIVEPDPNLLAQSRMRLDEALDAIPRRSLLDLLRANASAWIGHLHSAPALATLLVGVGFLGGNFTYRYQVAHQPVVAPPVLLSSATGGGIGNISGVTQLAGDRVQVSYNRIVPEMAQGSLDDPQILQLLMVGLNASAASGVRVDSVALLASQCRAGDGCNTDAKEGGIRGALLACLQSDPNPKVRLKALEGLQPYVSQDENVRDAVARALMTDSSAAVRSKAIAMLVPVQSDTSVRQALRTVSTTDVNPYIRTVSTEALVDSSSLQ
jgi:hypothetical protein